MAQWIHLPYLSLPLAWELHGGQDHLRVVVLSMVPGMHRVLSVSEPELPYLLLQTALWSGSSLVLYPSY